MPQSFSCTSSAARRYLAIALAFAPVLRADAQGFHTVAFTTGATTLSVDALNGVLTSARFSGLSNDGIAYGALGSVAFGRALLGVDVARTTFGEEGTSAGRSDDLNAMQLLATASYNVASNNRVSLFPTLGVGFGRVDITLRDRNGGATASASQPTFAEVAANPGTSTTVSGNHLLFSVGGGADFLITRSAASSAGVVFGVRGGYLIAPNRTTWTTGGHDVLTGPDASAGGPFVRVVIGFGAR